MMSISTKAASERVKFILALKTLMIRKRLVGSPTQVWASALAPMEERAVCECAKGKDRRRAALKQQLQAQHKQ